MRAAHQADLEIFVWSPKLCFPTVCSCRGRSEAKWAVAVLGGTDFNKKVITEPTKDSRRNGKTYRAPRQCQQTWNQLRPTWQKWWCYLPQWNVTSSAVSPDSDDKQTDSNRYTLAIFNLAYSPLHLGSMSSPTGLVGCDGYL